MIVGLIIGLLLWLGDEDRDGLLINLRGGLSIGLIFGLIFGLRYGGAACIQHFNLRLMLYFNGRIPWNYARFLDYATERLLMKKVGGGYVFFHRMLLEHFAEMDRVS